jgi:hypothetical protein
MILTVGLSITGALAKVVVPAISHRKGGNAFARASQNVATTATL